MIIKILIFIDIAFEVICGFVAIRRYKIDNDYKSFKSRFLMIIINIIFIITIILATFIVSLFFPSASR